MRPLVCLLFVWFIFSWISFKLARNKACLNQCFDFRDNIVSMDIYFDQMSYTVLKQLKAMDESSLLSKSIQSGMLTTFAQCIFPLGFLEILSQNHFAIIAWVSGNSKIMHCGIFNTPYTALHAYLLLCFKFGITFRLPYNIRTLQSTLW